MGLSRVRVRGMFVCLFWWLNSCMFPYDNSYCSQNMHGHATAPTSSVRNDDVFYSPNQGCCSASRAVIRRRGSRHVILQTRSWNCGSTGCQLRNGALFLPSRSKE